MDSQDKPDSKIRVIHASSENKENSDVKVHIIDQEKVSALNLHTYDYSIAEIIETLQVEVKREKVTVNVIVSCQIPGTKQRLYDKRKITHPFFSTEKFTDNSEVIIRAIKQGVLNLQSRLTKDFVEQTKRNKIFDRKRSSGWLPFDSELTEEGWAILVFDMADIYSVIMDEKGLEVDWGWDRIVMVGYKFKTLTKCALKKCKYSNIVCEGCSIMSCDEHERELTHRTNPGEGELPEEKYILNTNGKTGSEILRWFNTMSVQLADDIRNGKNIYAIK